MLNIVDRKPSSLNELCKLYKHKTQRLGVKKRRFFIKSSHIQYQINSEVLPIRRNTLYIQSINQLITIKSLSLFNEFIILRQS